MRIPDNTLSEIVDATGLSKSYVSMLIRGKRGNPSLDTLKLLASHFGCPIDKVTQRLAKLRNGKKSRRTR